MEFNVSTGNRTERSIHITGIIILFLSIVAGTYFSFYWLFLLPAVAVGVFWAIVDSRRFYWFFLFSIPFSVQIYLPGGLSTTLPDEPLMWFFLLSSILSLAAYGYRFIPRWFFQNPITIIVFLHYLWLLLAVIFSEIFLPSLKFFIAKTWFLNAFFLLPIFFFKEKQDFIRAFKLVFIPFVFIFIFVFLRHAYLDFGFRESNMAAEPLFYNHVDHSTVLSMCLPVFIIAYHLNKGNKQNRLLLLAVIIFLIPAIMAAQARAAMLAVFFSLTLWYAFTKRIGHWVVPAFYALIITITTMVVSNENYVGLRPDFKHTYTQPNFEHLMKATVAGKDMSSMERLYRWIASARMSQERPLLGVGPNNWYEFYKEHALSEFKTYVSRNPERSTTHNYFIFMLTEQGWPALIIYAVLVCVFLAYAQRVYWRVKDVFYRKVVLGLAMVFGAGFVNNFFSELLETHKIGALFFMSMSLIMIIDHIHKRNERIENPDK